MLRSAFVAKSTNQRRINWILSDTFLACYFFIGCFSPQSPEIAHTPKLYCHKRSRARPTLQSHRSQPTQPSNISPAKQITSRSCCNQRPAISSNTASLPANLFSCILCQLSWTPPFIYLASSSDSEISCIFLSASIFRLKLCQSLQPPTLMSNCAGLSAFSILGASYYALLTKLQIWQSLFSRFFNNFGRFFEQTTMFVSLRFVLSHHFLGGHFFGSIGIFLGRFLLPRQPLSSLFLKLDEHLLLADKQTCEEQIAR